MNLYLLSQDENDGWDTYDSCVVAAKTEDDARRTHPREKDWDWHQARWGNWASNPGNVTVTLIGKAVKGTESGVICSSFNAG